MADGALFIFQGILYRGILGRGLKIVFSLKQLLKAF